jgi:hypothetical protein
MIMKAIVCTKSTRKRHTCNSGLMDVSITEPVVLKVNLADQLSLHVQVLLTPVLLGQTKLQTKRRPEGFAQILVIRWIWTGGILVASWWLQVAPGGSR